MKPYREITVDDLAAHPDARLIDVREPHEYDGELGHLPGAELVPLAEVPTALRSWDPDQELVVICRSGARSSRVARFLGRLGFRRVYNLDGGMLAVALAGWPASEGALT
jgi:rhodanese-related sulfurtransferase